MNKKDKKYIYICSFSGGKDSTAMLLLLLKHPEKYPLDYIIFCDTGIEYPQVYEHIKQVEERFIKPAGKQLTTLKSDLNLAELIKSKGWWPHFNSRYCTSTFKRDLQRHWLKKQFPTDQYKIITYCGFATDEQERIKYNYHKKDFLYPLIDFNMNEKQALQLCYDNGLNWGGLYNWFDRTGCAICPFMRVERIYTTIEHFPELVEKIREIEKYTTDKFHKYGIDYYVEKYKKIKEKKNE